MNARTAALLLILTAAGAIAGCSWNPFGPSLRTEPTRSTPPAGDATNAAPYGAPTSSDSSRTSAPTRGAWPTTPVPPVTGNEVATGRRKAACTTAERLQSNC